MRVIHHTYHHADGIVLECELEYDKGDDSVGLRPAAWIMSAKVGGVDILPLLDAELVDRIEGGAAWSMHLQP